MAPPTLTNNSNFFNVLSQLNLGSTQPLAAVGNSVDQDYIKKTVNNAQAVMQDYEATNPMSDILEVQTQYNNVMEQEYNYLQTRERQIKMDIETGERMMKLNDSNRKKYYAYVYIVMIWVCVVILILLLVYLNRYLGIPFNFFFAIIVTIGVLWSAWLLYSISVRDPIDYDKLNLQPPNLSPSTAGNSIFGLGPSPGTHDISACVGAECCPIITQDGYTLKYNVKDNLCELEGMKSRKEGMKSRKEGKEGFVTMSNFLDYYPPMSISKLFPVYLHNYPCEGEEYCTYRDETRTTY